MSGADNLYLDRSREHLIDLIQHLLLHSHAIVFLEGPSGSGRSRLLQHLEQQLHSVDDLADRPLAIIDDANQLAEYELTRLVASATDRGLLIAGLPGTCETIKQGGFFGTRSVERLVIAPFTPSEAGQFINQHCAPVSARIRDHLINQCRLYPGELLQATYDAELSQRKQASSGWRKWWFAVAATLTISLTVIGIQTGLFKPILHDLYGPLDRSGNTTGKIIRETDEPLLTTQASMTELPVIAEQQPPLLIEEELANDISQTLLPKPAQEEEITDTASRAAEKLMIPRLEHQQLLRANSQHFTLQLMLASELENIDRLISRFNLAETAFRYAKTVDLETLYCLVVGNFETYEAAGEAIGKLPVDLQKMGPWRRRFGDIQEELSTSAVID